MTFPIKNPISPEPATHLIRIHPQEPRPGPTADHRLPNPDRLTTGQAAAKGASSNAASAKGNQNTKPTPPKGREPRLPFAHCLLPSPPLPNRQIHLQTARKCALLRPFARFSPTKEPSQPLFQPKLTPKNSLASRPNFY